MAIRQREVISRLKAGEHIFCTLPRGDAEGDEQVQFLQNGGRVTRATYCKIRESLEPVSPGLFADAEPQEWRWRND